MSCMIKVSDVLYSSFAKSTYCHREAGVHCKSEWKKGQDDARNIDLAQLTDVGVIRSRWLLSFYPAIACSQRKVVASKESGSKG